MRPPHSSTALVVAVAVAVLLGSAATSLVSAQAPPPLPDCFQALVNLSDCLSFFERGSKLAQPDPGCCPGLSSMVNTQPHCFCKLLGGGNGEIQMPIDSARARGLPATCHVSGSVSNCAGQGAAAPVGEGPGAPPRAMDGTQGDESSANTPSVAPSSVPGSPAGEDTSFAGVSRYFPINLRVLIGTSTLVLSYLFLLS